MSCVKSYAWFLNVLLNGEDLDSFSQPNVLPKLSKITDMPSVNKSEKVESILTCQQNDYQSLTTVFSLLNTLGIYIFFLILEWASIGEGR